MWTDASRDAMLISETVSEPAARHLLYQARVNLRLFNFARDRLHEAMDELNAEDFARVASNHMTEGVFGADKHRANQMMLKEDVLGLLLAVVTAGHRFTRSVKGARTTDRGRDWRELRSDIDQLERTFHRVRNFMEHLDEAIAKGGLAQSMDCTFTPDAVLTCKQREASTDFTFSRGALESCQEVYDSVLQILEKRKITEPQDQPVNEWGQVSY